MTIIPMLWTLLTTIKTLCRVINRAAPIIRPFVPPDRLEEYDTHVTNLKLACQVFLDFDFLDGNPATTDGAGHAP